MIRAIVCPALSAALEKLKEIITLNETNGKNTVIFCEDRLTLAAERTVCSAVGGTFSTSVFTFARFLASERGKRNDVLSSQGSAMAIRAIIEQNRGNLKLFGKFSASSAAEAVYDTIALLYSSKISAEDVAKAGANGLLESKLHDISVIYSAYNNYLKENGKTDRNAYLSELPEVICKSARLAHSEVIFLGFQSFTRSSLECVRAAFETAENVHGLFIGGAEEIYVNEGAAAFIAAARGFGGAVSESVPSTLIPEAEALRKNLFDPDCFYSGEKTQCSNVSVFEAADEEEELEFIAASIKKHVLDGGERYAKISVMVPDVASAERDINRVFSEYRIPYYADRRRKLSEHPVCAFICDYLGCAVSGCSFKDCEGVISSPMFPAERADKDEYRNYALRLVNFRGGIKREPKREILETMNFDYGAVQRVREKFLRGLDFISQKGGIRGICAGLRSLLSDFKVEEKLKSLSENFKDSYPTVSEFSKRVYDAALKVIGEAEEIAGADVTIKEFIKILKSGFAALEISLIPPKADAVFVGDLAATANTGSNVVFAARLTGDVPASSSDTSLLTDREISALESVNLDISPKIRQVNMRRRELTALNICAFRKSLYLTYPVRSGGEECGVSEIVSYACAVFATKSNARIKALNFRLLEKDGRALPYYCSEKLPALKRLSADCKPETLASLYGVLKDAGYGRDADIAVKPPEKKSVSDGRALFVTYNSVSPTALETYFSCPFRNFMQQGLKLKEREEGAMRPLDTGNFIHTVLQTLAPEICALKDGDSVLSRSREISEELLKTPAYCALNDSKSGEYTASELIKEAAAVSLGMYEQLINSGFKVEKCESRCEIALGGGIKINGRIDRVDSYGDMVRIIDYKTGSVDASATNYYTGLKLQLPLYLSAEAKGRRAAAAYYFPAATEYKTKADGVFRLQGFMDGSDEVVSASDLTLQPKKKSEYFDAYLGGKKIDGAMEPEVFADFLKYSVLVASKGAEEMLEGNVSPSPVADACKYCRMGGSCGFAAGADGAERTCRTVKCADIAEIVRRAGGGEK